MYHVSDIKKFNKCKRLYYLSLNRKEDYQPFLRNDETLSDLLIKRFDIKDHYQGQKGDDPARVFEYLEQYEWFIKPRFEYANLRIKLPLLRKVKDGFAIYFFFLGLYPQSIDLNYYSAHLWVIEKLGLKIKDVYFIYLNSEYERGADLDVQKLFIVDDHLLKKDKERSELSAYEMIKAESFDLKETLLKMDTLKAEDIRPIKSHACKGRGLCSYYGECFKDERYEDDSILTLVSSRYKYLMYQKGIKTLKDVDTSLLEGTKVQYAQIMADRLGGLFYDRCPLKRWLEDLKGERIAFIDFEWERYLIPPFSGLKPYDVVCFEYSVHILNKDGSLIHHDFLGVKDCREEFIKSLLKDIPKDAKVVAYNAKGAEILRLKELGEQFPKYKEELADVISRTYDLAYPFVNGLVYDIKMAGNYSVKSLLKVVSSLSYDEMAIHNGMGAVYEWRDLDKDLETVDTLKVSDELRQYCAMDTYSLVLIYCWLKDLCDKPVSKGGTRL